jgi:Pentapeptide repeats (8 copies)
MAYTLLVLVLISAFVVAYEWSPWWIDGARPRKLSAKDETIALATDRDEVLKIVAGFAGAVAVLYTIRRHNIDRRTLETTQRSVVITQQRDAETVRLTTEAQMTDRYIKAIGLLASERPDERLGGIYEQWDSGRRGLGRRRHDQGAIPLYLSGESQSQGIDFGRRLPWPSQSKRCVPGEGEFNPCGLYRSNLNNARFDNANLTGAQLTRAGLKGASLRGANLTGADLTDAELTFVSFDGADLTGVTLVRNAIRFTNWTDGPLPGVHGEGRYHAISRASYQRPTHSR